VIGHLQGGVRQVGVVR